MPPMKQLRLTVLILLVTGSLAYFGIRYTQPPVIKKAVNGVIDFRSESSFDEPVTLAGNWGFYWNELLTSKKNAKQSPEFFPFPSLWNKITINGKQLPSEGYATYSATIFLPVERPQIALEMPANYCSYALFINDSLYAHNGQPGKTAETSTPFFGTQLVLLPAHVDSVTLMLQVSNFWHYRGGSNEDIRLAAYETLLVNRERNFATDLTLTGCLFMGGLFFLGLYLFGRHDKTILYFSLFCMVYSYRMVGSGVYVLHALFPALNWWVTLKLEYLTLSVGIAFFVRYTMNLFPAEANNLFNRILFWFCIGYSAIVLLASAYIFTSLLNIFLLAMFISIGYALFIYIQAARHKRTGATYALISTGVMLLVFLLMNLNFFGLIAPFKAVVFSGYIAFFFLQSLVLSHRFAHTLKKSAFDAEQGLKAKSEFLSTMSHEIRTPLNAVIGMTHLLLGDQPRKDQQENLDVLLFSANNLLVIVNDILDFSKIELGKINLEQISMDIPSIARNLVAGLKELAVEKRVELRLTIDKQLDKKLIGDPTRTAQVINNLLHNAVKFTHQGSVQLSITVQESDAETMTLLISVKDTGIGISKDKQKLIFERFTQADSSTSRSYGGTGLGLAICKKLLELQGSKLQLESEPAEGSCFYFIQTYPISKEKSGVQPEPLALYEDDAELLTGVTILLVEDNPYNVMVAQSILERSGTIIQVASNGEEALEKYKRGKYDLILMDLHMPIMDGYQATAILRSEGETIPVIALTASTKAEVEKEVLAAGLNDVIVKPFSPQDLFRVILQHIHPLPR
jgi:signal transduction histidine kinase